ncbi:RsiV family protein [Mycobacterium sp. LTG2003]
MLFSGGRILVAAAGAIVLVIVAIYAVRSVWWDPNSKSASITSPTSVSGSIASTPETDGSGGGGSGDASGGGSGGDTGGGGGSGGGDAGAGGSSETPTEQPPFTAATEQVQRFLGTVFVDVEVPRVEGGNPEVATVFNDEMDTALQAQADSVTGGSLEGRPGSEVRIGERVLSGVLRTAAVDLAKAHTMPLASTVVVDSESGSLITLSSLFNDLDEGLARLQEESETLGPNTDLGDSFDTSGLEPTEEVFGRWSAESSGMRVFFEQGVVGPMAAGIVELTIPWDNLSDVMKPGVADIVAS